MKKKTPFYPNGYPVAPYGYEPVRYPYWAYPSPYYDLSRVAPYPYPYTYPYGFQSAQPVQPAQPVQSLLEQWQRPVEEHAGGPERASERHPHTKHIDWASMFPGEVILKGPDRKEVALTFDDGPDDVWTTKVADMLKQFNVKATFMCVGKRCAANPEVLRRLDRDGHVIGNHTWNHPNLTKIPLTEVQSQVERTNDEIFRLIGKRPTMFRPPYGALNADVIKELIKLKEKIVFWDVDSLDWDKLTAEQVAHNILSNVRPGAIILQHAAGGRGESLQDTVNSLPYVINTLRREGYTFRTVPELVGVNPYQTT